jgi:hypothetical protein
VWPAIVFAGQAVDDLAIAELDRPTLADTRERTTNGIRPARGVNGYHGGGRRGELRCSARLRKLKDKLETRAAATTVNTLDAPAAARDRQATVMPTHPPANVAKVAAFGASRGDVPPVAAAYDFGAATPNATDVMTIAVPRRTCTERTLDSLRRL